MIRARLSEIALIVDDLDASTSWYQRAFDRPPAVEHRDGPQPLAVEFALDDRRRLTLHQQRPGADSSQSRSHTAGLDAIVLNCSSRADLHHWTQRLDELGIGHNDIPDTGTGWTSVSLHDLDGIALQLIAPTTVVDDNRKLTQ